MTERTLPDFLIIPSAIIEDLELQPLDGYVYGLVYWYKRLKLQKCIASNEQMAEMLHVKNSRSISNSLTRLKRKGYVEVVMDKKLNQRLEIIPLVSFTRTEANLIDTPSSNDEPPFIKSHIPPSSNDEHNNNSLIITSNNIYTEILEHWNSKGIIKHNKLTDKMKRAINGKMDEGHKVVDVVNAIDHYAEILEGKEYFFNYRWTLQDFIQRGFDKFLDLEIAKGNYKKGGQLNGEYQNPNRAEKGKYSDIRYEGDN